MLAPFLLWSAAICLSSGLMFLLEPLVSRVLLPSLGGAAAVWGTCVMFFQLLLLLGYAYAHGMTRLGRRAQTLTHLALFGAAAATLPMAVGGFAPPSGDGAPVLWLIATLATCAGAPFFVLAGTGPLLQVWFAGTATRAGRRRDPYVLFAASNAGSLAGLLLYPIVLEPRLSLAQQSRLWQGAFLGLGVLLLGCAAVAWRHPAAPVERAASPATTRATWRQRGRWVALAALPSSLMLGVTSYVSSNIAPMPLLWVIPLGLYLLTFIMAFGASAEAGVRPGRLFDRLSAVQLDARQPRTWLLLAAALGPVVLLTRASTSSLVWLVGMHFTVFFCVALLLHARLAASRPDAAHLAEFYLWIGVGGALGGMFNSLVAPLVCVRIHEYPLALAACLFFAADAGKPPGRPGRWLDLALPLALGAAMAGVPRLLRAADAAASPLMPFARGLLIAPLVGLLIFRRRVLSLGTGVIAVLWAASFFPDSVGWPELQARSFYNTHRVLLDASTGIRWLENGNTLHGGQRIGRGGESEPLGYYHRQGPLGDLFAFLKRRAPVHEVGVVGLGTGAMAAYSEAGQNWTFYEIDPAVIAIARDSGLFTYLAGARAAVRVVLGDGRRSLAAAGDAAFDLLAIDAFGSDAIPVHLLTNEAVQLYRRKLRDGGLLVFHVSNRYLDLPPLVARLARQNGLRAWYRAAIADEDERREGFYSSQWLVLAPPDRALAELGAEWSPLDRSEAPLWRDDFASVVPLLRF